LVTTVQTLFAQEPPADYKSGKPVKGLLLIKQEDNSFVICSPLHIGKKMQEKFVNWEDACGEIRGFPNTFEFWKGDLNSDGIDDYILTSAYSRSIYDITTYIVYIGRGENLYDEAAILRASSVEVTNETKNGYRVLSAMSECYFQEKNVKNEYASKVIYDSLARQYRTELLRERNIDEEESLCGLGNAPSFDCEKSASVVEKLICNNRRLSLLDIELESNYKQIKSQYTGDKAKPLTLDQRNWLRQRNSCKSVDCLIGSYNRRIEELCVKYPLVTDPITSCISRP